jgi:hypothetical protein
LPTPPLAFAKIAVLPRWDFPSDGSAGAEFIDNSICRCRSAASRLR